MKRFVIVVGVVVIALVALWSAAWVYFARQIDVTLAGLSAGSPSVTCEKADVAGFPFRFDLTCSGATFANADMTLTLPEWRATILVYRPTHILFFAKNPAHLSDAFLGSEREIGWDDLEASLRLNGTRVERFSVIADAVSVDNALFSDAAVAAADHAEFHLVDAASPGDAKGRMTLAAYFSATAVTTSLPELATLDASLDAYIDAVPDDVTRWADPGVLADWQAAGGNVVVNALKAEAADSSDSVSAAGHLGLSPQGTPTGTLTVTSRGLATVANQLSPELGAYLLGPEQPDGSNSQVLQFDQGLMRAGIVPLLQFDPLF